MYFVKKEEAASHAMSTCSLVFFFVVSVLITIAELIFTEVNPTDLYEHIVFSAFIRLDSVVHLFLYLFIFLDYQTYEWYVANWKRNYFFRKAISKQLQDENKKSDEKKDKLRQIFGELDENEIEERV